MASPSASSAPRPVPSPRPPIPRSLAPLGLAVGSVAVLAVAGMIGFQVATWDKIAPGVVALGTPVGGLSQTEAAARLRPQIETLLNRPLQIRYAELAWNTTARELGLRLDPTDLVQAAYRGGREGGPIARFAEQLGVLAGGQHLVVSSTTDQAALDESLDRIAREVDRPAQDARLTLGTDGTVHFMGARIGLTVDVAGSRARVLRALGDSSPFVELVVRETAPVITNEMVQPAREQLERLLGGGTEPPLTLTFGEQKWLLERSEVIQLLSLEGGTKAGQPVTVNIDEASLRALAERLANEVDQSVQDARFAWNGGNLKPIRESREGRELDQAATVALVRAKLVAGERWAELPVTVVKPAVSSKDAKSLGIVGLIDRGSTSFAGSIAEKKHNIRLAAERLNGVVVPPGGTFSFNKEVGPTTLAAGFKWGFGITSGEEGVKTVPSVAGGICQVATTLFQPVFWAGYPLEERYWHLYWIPAYTSRGIAGLDVTVDEEAGLDFKWVNPTDDHVLIQAATDEERIYFSLYGKKPKWTVHVDEPKVTNRTPPDPKPVAHEEPTLPWGRTLQVETAREGFEVVVTRTVVSPDGGEPRTLHLKSTYQPSRTVTLVGTAGKPADARVEDAIARILGTDGPSENKPAATPQAGAPPVDTGPAPAAEPTAAVAEPPAPEVRPTPAPAAPKPQPSPGAGSRAATAPSPAPTRAP